MAIGELLPFLLIGVLFWLIFLRPQRKRQLELQKSQREAEPGTRIMLTSGILATVVENSADRTLVEISDGVVVEIARAAIGHVLPEDEDETDDETDTQDETTTLGNEPDTDEPGTAEASKEN